ncbi:MAG: hypothetical protein LBD87_05100 [Prevotellaceae bacterium]|jgi:hypothetical protein|nr:hypothetical protein [Prevotellaceae bacterium]
MMKKMMFLAALLMSFAATAPLFADNDEKEQNEPFAVYKFPAKDIEKVTVLTFGGSIRVNGDATGEAVVEVWIRPSSGWKKLSKEEIKKILDAYYLLSVKSVAGELHVEAGRASGKRLPFNNGLSISFHLSVPQKAASKLSTSGGSIHIRNLTGKEELNTSGGSLHIVDVSGTVTGRTSGGSIHLSGSKGEIELATSGGSIHAENSEGQLNLKTAGGSLRLSGLGGNIDAATSGGSIHLSDLTGTVKAKTSGGSVHADHVNGTLATGTSGGSMKLADIAGNLEAHTSGGSMNVQITSVAEYVRLSNTGNISLALPGGKGYTLKIQGNRIETEAIKNFQGAFESKNIEGTLNGGGAEISVKSSQRVRLTFE